MPVGFRGTAKNAVGTNGADLTMTFDTSPNEPRTGDIAFVFGGIGINSTTNLGIGPITSGYTAVPVTSGSNPQLSTNLHFGVWYKVMGNPADTQVQCEGGGSTRSAVSWGAFVLDGTTIDPVIFDATAVMNSAGVRVPNAPAITTVTANARVFAFAGCEVNDASRGTVTNYALHIGGNASDTDPFSCEAVQRNLVVPGVEDPGAWSTWTSATAIELTMAIRATQPVLARRWLGLLGAGA